MLASIQTTSRVCGRELGRHIFPSKSAEKVVSRSLASVSCLDMDKRCSSIVLSVNDRFPNAVVEAGDRFLFSHRKHCPYAPEPFYGDIITKAKHAVKDVAMFDFSLPDFRAENLVNPKTGSACVPKLYDPFGDPSARNALTKAEKANYIFDPFIKRFSGFLHVDHHYPDPCLSRTSTTVLLLDLLLHAHETNNEDLIHSAQNALVIMDHADPDIVLSKYLASQASQLDYLQEHEVLFKKVALYNDYGVFAGNLNSEERELYHLLASFQSDIDAQRDNMAHLVTLLPEMVSFVARGRCEEAKLIDNFAERLDFARAKEVQTIQLIETYMSNFTLTDSSFSEGKAMILGRTFFLIQNSKDDALDNATVIEYLHQYFPDSLDQVSAVCTINYQNGFQVKLRSIKDEFGQVLDLNPVYTGLKMKDSNLYKETGGRALAGSLSKAPLIIEDNSILEKIIKDIAQTVVTVRANTSLF